MPWQRFVADVSHEVDPETGRLVYREVVLGIPRQSGKTTLGLTVRAHRALGFGGRQTLLNTAQTRNIAREKWEDEHAPILEASPLAPLVRQRKRTGAEAFVWRNGSIDLLPAPTAKAAHSKTLDFAWVDEAWAQVDDRLEQGIRPAMITRPEPQLWIVSTAGTAESIYLRRKVDAGRRREGEGAFGRVAYFEWSAPDDADPLDPATWWACMPALGHTIDEAAIRAELDAMLEEHGPDGLALFRRAYLNQWPDVFAAGWKVIGQRAWAALADPASQAIDPLVFAVDANPERTAAAVAVAGRRSDGRVHGEVVQYAPGLDWVVPWLAERIPRWQPWAVVIDPGGPAGSLLPDLPCSPMKVTGREFAQACGAVYDLAGTDRLRHLDQPELDDAVKAACKRPVGDGLWVWSRRDSVSDICPWVAVTLAAHGLAVAPGALEGSLMA